MRHLKLLTTHLPLATVMWLDCWLECCESRATRVALASDFRSYDGHGNARQQRRIRWQGKRAACALIRRVRQAPRHLRPNVWLTYHLYHKAPDWLGPAVAGALNIPYVIVEASHSPKQEHGPWSMGYHASHSALSGASAVVALNRADMACVEPVLASRAVYNTCYHFCSHR